MSQEVSLTCGPIYFRTLSEVRRELGLPTVDDLRRQFFAAAAAKAAAAAAEAEAAAAAAETAAAEAEAEELKNKYLGKSSVTNVEVENLKSASDPRVQVIGGDIGESSGTTLPDNPNPASGTEPKLKGKSIPKDIGESNKTEYLNPSANPTGASPGTKVEVKGSSVLKRPRKDIESIVEYLNAAATDTANVIKAEVEGGSVCKRPRKDLDRPCL